MLRYLALDAMGVLYQEAGVAGPLTRFAHQRGSAVSQSDARALYRRASAGEMDSRALWAALGVPGEPDECDRQWLAGRTLMPGAGDFLAVMKQWGVPVGCITNDLAAWSVRSRRDHRIEDQVHPWIVSAEVGARKPAQAIYDVFALRSGCQPEACLVVDDQVANLEAAAALGFRTVWFVPGASQLETDRARVTSFAQLQELVSLQVGLDSGLHSV